MLGQKCLGLSLWVWIVIIIVIIVYFNCQPMCPVKTSNIQMETKENFSNIKVFNFNTSWCGWSKKFQSEWDDFSNRVNSDSRLSHVEAIDIKCDDEKNESICKEYEVPGYPYVIVETNGERIKYTGERTADDLVQYVLNL